MEYPEFLATKQAREMFGDRYADYIQKHEIELIEKGHITLEYALNATLGDRLAGNNGI
jgi:hypothetical protein